MCVATLPPHIQVPADTSAYCIAAAEVQVCQTGEAAQGSREGDQQLVVVEAQCLQIGELAQLSWDSARQGVGVEGQCLQLGEVA